MIPRTGEMLEPAHGVVCGDSRVGVRRDRRGLDPCRKRDQRALVGEDEFGEAAVEREPREVVADAMHVVAATARHAQPAAERRVDEHRVALGDRRHVAADARDPARVLVAEHARQRHARGLHQAVDRMQVGRAHARAADADDDIARASRLRLRGNFLFMHRLVQSALREAMSKDELLHYAECVIQLSNEAFPGTLALPRWALVAQQRRIASQVLMPVRLVSSMKPFMARREYSCELFSLLCRLSRYFANESEFDDAEDLLVLELGISDAVFGEHSMPSKEIRMSELIDLYLRKHQYGTALGILRELYKTQSKRARDANNRKNCMEILKKIVLVFVEAGRAKDAISYMNQLLENNPIADGLENEKTLLALFTSVSLFYSHEERWKEAKLLLKQVLEIADGFDVSAFSAAQYCLAVVYKKRGAFKESAKRLREVLSWQLSAIGQNSHTLHLLRLLAEIYRERHRFRIAAAILQYAKDVEVTTLGGNRERLKILEVDLIKVYLAYSACTKVRWNSDACGCKRSDKIELAHQVGVLIDPCDDHIENGEYGMIWNDWGLSLVTGTMYLTAVLFF